MAMQADQQIMGLGGIIRLRQHEHISLLILVISRDERKVTRLARAEDGNESQRQHASQ
jgi:hypothetical protein